VCLRTRVGRQELRREVDSLRTCRHEHLVSCDRLVHNIS
jgi:hypothetical protein